MTVVSVAIKILSTFAEQLQLIDHPNHRKQHEGNIPLVGGIAMFLGLVMGVILLVSEYVQIIPLLFMSFVMLIIGIIDDRNEVTVFPKLFFQVIVALVMASILGVTLQSFGFIFGDNEVLTGKFGLFFTIIAIVGSTNSFNVMDGLDGLAGGLGIIIFSSISGLAYIKSNIDIFNITLVYIFTLLPFLYFNLSFKNKVFMGDAGTLLIGLGIVWLLIVCSQGEQNIFNPVTALWIFAVPLIDSVSIIFLRIKNRKSPFLPDLNHIHHQIKKQYKYTNQKIVIIILVISSLLSIVGILGQIILLPEWIMFLGFVTLFFLYLIFLLKSA
ncbi:hypothetical protein ABXT54_07150 [Methylophilaceae bacterium Uisw_099_01]